MPSLENTFSVHDSDALDALRKRLQLDPGYIRRVQAALFRSFQGAVKALDVVPTEHRAAFAGAVRWHELVLEERRDSQTDGATKLLFRTADGHAVESVILRIQSGRSSLCVSSQTGCAGGCRFCATGRIKGWRSLSAAEILDQAAWAGELLAAEGRQLRNVVFMGMGEPLQNEEAVFAALAQLRGKDGFHLSDRHLLVSTLGVPDAMRRLTDRFPQVGLAVSLHTVRQAIRNELMPMSRRWPLTELREACVAVNARQERALMIEILLLDGMTDTEADVAALIAWLRGLQVHINLIPFNAIEEPVAGNALDDARRVRRPRPTINLPDWAGRAGPPDPPRLHDAATLADERPLRGSAESRVQAILAQLKAAGFKATRRHSLGSDIGAACGQLAEGVLDPRRAHVRNPTNV